jgi:hypothetical protein
LAKREEYDVFEVVFRIAALVESDEQGQRVFKIYEHAVPVTAGEFTSVLETLYQQEVYPMLKAGDSVTIRAHLDFPFPPRDVERTLRFREDQQFEGEGVPKPTPDLLLLASAVYEPFIQKVNFGEVLTVEFDVQRS